MTAAWIAIGVALLAWAVVLCRRRRLIARCRLDRAHPYVFNHGHGGYLSCRERTLVVFALDDAAMCPDCGEVLRHPDSPSTVP